MSTRRDALLARYRAASLERVARLLDGLDALAAGAGTEELRRELGRSLHTLKGDSVVVGNLRLGNAVHHAEALYAPLKARDEAPDAASLEPLRMLLRGVERILSEGTTDAEVDARLGLSAADGVASAAGASITAASVNAASVAAASITAASLAAASSAAATAPGEPLARTDAPLAAPAAPGQATVPVPGGVHPGPLAERWLQISADRVDALCETASDLGAELRSVLARVLHSAAAADRTLSEEVDRCRSRLDALVSSAWELRLVDVEPSLREHARHARELGRESGKRVRVVVDAGHAQVERNVLDALQQPLLHLVRNAVDHGVELPSERGAKPPDAVLRLQARTTGPFLSLTVSDDGRGVNPDEVKAAAVRRGLLSAEAARMLAPAEVMDLLFLHGFSTREVVSQVSGRGVGLDIVRSAVEALGGSVKVHSEKGEGTRFELRVPASVTRERVLVTECDGVLYGLPGPQVVDVLRGERAELVPVIGGVSLRHRGELIPVRSLAATLGAPEPPAGWLLVLEVGARRWAFQAPTAVGDFELLRRPTDALISREGLFSGSATLEDGRVVLLLSPAMLVRRAQDAGTTVPAGADAGPARRRTVLVVDDSVTVRDLVGELLSEAGLEVTLAEHGAAALAHVRQGVPDLVLTDLEMPVMDGFELLRSLRGEWPNLPVVMLTTRGSAEDRRRASGLGANAYLVKSELAGGGLVETVCRLVGAAA